MGRALREILYISQVTKPLSEKDLDNLVKASRSRNAALNVTGALIFDGKTFMQLLEGYPEDLLDIYTSIFSDHRHHQIVTICNGPINSRNFEDWSMHFKHKSPSDPDFHELGGFLDAATYENEAIGMARLIYDTEFRQSA